MRGRPRSEAARGAILRAALELLQARGFAALSVDAIAARAGVGKATIYRRYPSREALVKAAISHLQGALELPVDHGSVRGDIAALAHVVGGTARRTDGTKFMARMLAEAAHEPEMHEIFMETMVNPRRAAVRALIERGIARGEVRADIDPELVVDLIVGPMIYRQLLGGLASDEVEARALAIFDAVFEGLMAR